MVEPVSSLAIPALGGNTKAAANEAALSTAAQTGRIAGSIANAEKVSESQKAEAAEKAQIDTLKRYKVLKSKRKKPKAPNSPWVSQGAQSLDDASDPWTIATGAQRLSQIDSDLVGRELNLAA